MSFNKKYIIQGFILNTILWIVFLVIPYILSHKILTEYLNTIFGKNDMAHHFTIIAILFGLTLIFCNALITLSHYFLARFLPEKWLTVTLLKKSKIHLENSQLNTGIPKSVNVYRFVFKDHKNKKYQFEGCASQYESFKEGEKVKIRVKASNLVEMISLNHKK